jgi:hypothetical protein
VRVGDHDAGCVRLWRRALRDHQALRVRRWRRCAGGYLRAPVPGARIPARRSGARRKPTTETMNGASSSGEGAWNKNPGAGTCAPRATLPTLGPRDPRDRPARELPCSLRPLGSGPTRSSHHSVRVAWARPTNARVDRGAAADRPQQRCEHGVPRHRSAAAGAPAVADEPVRTRAPPQRRHRRLKPEPSVRRATSARPAHRARRAAWRHRQTRCRRVPRSSAQTRSRTARIPTARPSERPSCTSRHH